MSESTLQQHRRQQSVRQRRTSVTDHLTYFQSQGLISHWEHIPTRAGHQTSWVISGLGFVHRFTLRDAEVWISGIYADRAYVEGRFQTTHHHRHADVAFPAVLVDAFHHVVRQHGWGEAKALRILALTGEGESAWEALADEHAKEHPRGE